MPSHRRLFPALLGPAFATLPRSVQALHLAASGTRFVGEAEVTRGRHALARLMGLATRLPPTGRCAVEVRIDEGGTQERWSRRFGRHRMPSRLWADGAHLREQLGLVRFDFLLSAIDGALHWRVRAVRVLGLPLPARWFDGVWARESEQGGRYAFEVQASLPICGLLVHYRGQLDGD